MVFFGIKSFKHPFVGLLLIALLASSMVVLLIQSNPVQAETQDASIQISDDFYMASGSENDIYAIATDGNVWHWNGAWWWQVTSGRTIEKRIYVDSTSQIYGLSQGASGLELLKWNGQSWLTLTANGGIKDGLFFVSEQEIYGLSADNQVYLWNGYVWAKVTSGGSGVKDHLQVVSPSEIYAISLDQKLVRWNGVEWQPFIDGTVHDFFIVKSINEVYALNDTGALCLWNGATWTSIANGPFNRRFTINSMSEAYGLGSDKNVWQWNGEQQVAITDPLDSTYTESGTYYRAKFLGGVLIAQPALLAYKDYLIVVGPGRAGSLYAREWTPLSSESWDTARNGEYFGLTDWYALDGSSPTSPQLSIENGSLYVTIKNSEGALYRKQYYSLMNWSSWEFMGFGDLTSGPFISKGFTIIPSNSSGYPSQISLVKFKTYNVNSTKPDWMDNLIIYELNTQTFTSPNGPQTGNFQALTQKLDYLQELGVTAIWVSGYSWSDPKHFGNIYTQYANIDPALIEPTLGTDPTNNTLTEQEFKALIEAAHQRGIKVIVDMVAHGLMSYSPIVSANATLPPYVAPHPNQPNVTAHPDWFNAITNPDYREVPIDQDFRGITTRMIDFVGGYDQSDLDDWWVNTYADIVLDYGFDGFRIDLGSSRFDLLARVKDRVQQAGGELIIVPEGDPDDYPFQIGVYDFEQVDGEWLPLSTLNTHDLPDPAMGIAIADMKDAEAQVFPNLKRQYNTIPISCHDSNAYNLKGSLFKAGYGTLFTPFIPMFMAGEEFNNSYSPVPASNGLWLLPSEVQWQQLNNSANNAFYQACRKAIEIRKTEPALHYFASEFKNTNTVVVTDYTSSATDTPSPYMRYLPNTYEAVLIVGNSNPVSAVAVTMKMPLSQTNMEGFDYYTVKDLWTGDSSVLSRQVMDSYNLTVDPDNFRIVKLTPYPTNTPAPTQSPSTSTETTAVSPNPTPNMTPQTPSPTPTVNPSNNPNPTGTPFQQAQNSIPTTLLIIGGIVTLVVVIGGIGAIRDNRRKLSA